MYKFTIKQKDGKYHVTVRNHTKRYVLAQDVPVASNESIDALKQAINCLIK